MNSETKGMITSEEVYEGDDWTSVIKGSDGKPRKMTVTEYLKIRRAIHEGSWAAE